jgi:serine/threonine protein phosphatase PrpC
VEEQFCGKHVQCGRCGKAFLAQMQAEDKPPAQILGQSGVFAPVPPASAAPSSAPPAPAAAPADRGGLLSGLSGIFRALASKAPALTRSIEPDDVKIELDGPAASLPAEPASAPAPATAAARAILPLPNVWRLDVGYATSAGCVRPRNEDSFLVQHVAWFNLDQHHEAAILVVADGMGGYEAGDQASGMVIRTLGGSLAGLLGEALLGSLKDGAAAGRLDLALKAANRTIHQKSQTDAGCKGMGATAAAAFICDGQVQIGHVGDCRVYHFRQGKLLQVTRDQTLVARMVELGQLSAAEARTHPKRNEVTQAVGRYPDLQPAAYQCKLSPGDWLVAACDGLHAHVDEERLVKVLTEGAPSATALAHHLVGLANESGGSDNCTVVAVRCY